MFELSLGLIPLKKIFLFGSGCTSLGISYLAYRNLPEPKLRGKLRKVFNAGGLYSSKKGWKGSEIRILPKIQGVKISKQSTELTFTIPFGLDPTLIEKHIWLFHQQFRENLEVKNEGKKYTLTIHHDRLPKILKYNYEIIAQHFDGLRLPIVVGQSLHGWKTYDMVESPHLLVAGETGSGKSTQLRSILVSLILTLEPDELELYLGDLKRSEFHLFRQVNHVQEVVTDTKKLLRMLKKIKQEMERRGDLLDQYGCTHIDELQEKLPYIVVCIDEVALLKKEKDIMAIVEDISAIGRALGVFLILSMQRPDADVLDGKLKNNLTVRMAFRHSDEINSRITIGSGDAAHISISDRGRLYFKHEKLEQVQSPFLTTESAKKLLEPYIVSKGRQVKQMGEVVRTEQEQIFGVLGDDNETAR